MELEKSERVWTNQQIVAALFAVVSGLIGSVAFKQSEGYFVTYMTGNAQKAVLGFFHHSASMAVGAMMLSFSFFLGVFTGSMFNRRVWKRHPHGSAIITTLSLAAAAIFAYIFDQSHSAIHDLWLWDLIFVAFGTGSLNASFTKDGETIIPLTYHTGTLVKFAQGVEKHCAGGSYKDWIKYAIMYASFSLGALIGGILGVNFTGEEMLVIATVSSGLAAWAAYRIP